MFESTTQVVPSAEVFGPDTAAVVFFGWIFWQVYAPKLLDVDTALGPLFELPDRVEAVEDRAETLHETVSDLDQKQVHHIQVTRANSRALDERRDVTIDSEHVDEYLVDNGIPVAVLTRDQTDESDDNMDVDHMTDQVNA